MQYTIEPGITMPAQSRAGACARCVFAPLRRRKSVRAPSIFRWLSRPPEGIETDFSNSGAGSSSARGIMSAIYGDFIEEHGRLTITAFCRGPKSTIGNSMVELSQKILSVASEERDDGSVDNLRSRADNSLDCRIVL